jgi:putative aldouronate transport system substrate-binding protein
VWVYKPWLETVGLEEPTTTDEFYEMLKAFKEQDPNGNGQADEIPFTGCVDGHHTKIFPWLMGAFLPNNEGGQLPFCHMENGKVVAGFAQPEWKEGLEYIHRLYEEGLIDPNALTQTQDQLKAIGENPDVVIMGAAAGHWFNEFMSYGGESTRWKDMICLNPVEGPAGVRYAGNDGGPELGLTTGTYVISANTEHPEVAFRLGDAFYDIETTLRTRYGVLDEDWTWGKPGQEPTGKGIPGLDVGDTALFDMVTPWSQEGNFTWRDSGPYVMWAEQRTGRVFNPDNPLNRILNMAATPYYEVMVPDSMYVQEPWFTEEAGREVGEIQTTVYAIFEEMTARFISGDADLDAEWESYVASLKDAGLDRMLELYAEALT